jgi:hypothetical protein
MHALIRIVMILGSVLLLGLGTIRIAHAADARADSVAMVTDVQGKATLSTAGIAHDISILTEIADQSQIDLAQATRLVALWLRSGEEFAFVGPAAIRFTPAGPQMLSGATPTRRPSALERAKDIRIRTSGITQAAVVMRSLAKSARIRLLTLVGTRTLDPNPEFRWQSIPGVPQYRFELADVTGRVLLEVDVTGDAYRLPAAVKLDEGATYTWELSTRLPDGRKYASLGDFSITTAAQRERAEAIRPGADASLAERVAFALWLDQQELRDEARKYWKDAAAERPEDAKLRQLAGE